MRGITDATIEEVKARTDLSELVASYGVQVRMVGAIKKACCPFHTEKTPSFVINDNKGFYHCFGCGENGDAITFVQKMEGLTFVEAVEKLAEQCGVKIEEHEDPAAGRRKRLLSLMAELAQFYHRCLLKAKEAQLAREYLAKRDLGPDVQESFLIGYAPIGIANISKWAKKYGYSMEEMDEAGVVKAPRDEHDRGYHRFGGRLMFSIRDKQGRVVAFSGRQLVASKNSGKYVNSPETPIFRKSSVLFGFDKAAGNIAKSPHREAIVCEGQIDTIRLHISGFPIAVASQGTAFTEEHAKMLKKVADQVVLVFDDDAAGHKATIRSAGLFLAEEMPVRVVSLPEGDDPDSFLRKHSPEDFQKLLDNAESIMSFQVRAERAKEKTPDSIDAVARITKAVLSTIAQSQNAVIRAGMVSEAAKLLGLPNLALNEELEKLKSEPPKRHVNLPEDESPDDVPAVAVRSAPIPGEAADSVVPPPPREMAMMAFLMASEYDKTLDGMIGEFLPNEVFSHEFTKAFVDVWRREVSAGEDLFPEFSAKLKGRESEWFNLLLMEDGKTQSSVLDRANIMQEFVRSLWADELKRRRGNLAAAGDEAAERSRVELSLTLKRLTLARWPDAKEIIRGLVHS